VIHQEHCGLLDRPVEPGDDGLLEKLRKIGQIELCRDLVVT
jgi:hypothetical protein